MFKIEYIKIPDLKAAPYNPRKISDTELAKLRKSIKEFGMVDPLIVNADFMVIGGHQRLKAAEAEGMTEVPCVVIDIPKEKEKVLNLALNKISGEWDEEMLANLLQQMDAQSRQDAGFDTEEVTKVLNKYMNPEEDDFTVEVPKIPVTQPGDVWQLGPHRLMCGSSTKPEDVTKIMDSRTADMIFTDPPYNVNYKGTGENTSRTIANDNMAEAEFQQFLDGVFTLWPNVTKPNGGVYVCYASSTHTAFESGLNKAGYKVKNQIVWVKPLATMGWGDYRWKHELILYCSLGGKEAAFYGDRTEYTVWEKEPTDAEIVAQFRKQITHEEAGNSTVWKFSRDSNYEHPTQKPLDLCATAIRNSSQLGDVVFDPFGGSGSTLIACHQLDRTCYTMELDPAFCDVIKARWEKLTGETAEKLHG